MHIRSHIHFLDPALQAMWTRSSIILDCTLNALFDDIKKGLLKVSCLRRCQKLDNGNTSYFSTYQMNLSRLIVPLTVSSPKIDRLLIKLNQSAHAYHSLMSRPVQGCHTSQRFLLTRIQSPQVRNVTSQKSRSYCICSIPRTIISTSLFPILTPTPPRWNTLSCGFSIARSTRMGIFCVPPSAITTSHLPS